MCCCLLNCLIKCVMSVVNALLLIIGIVLLVIGALLLWGFNHIMKGLYSIEDNINGMLRQFGVSGDSKAVLDLVQTNANTIGAIAFGVGVVLVVLAILGIIFVACCDIQTVLIIIVLLLTLITIGLIVLIAYFGINKAEKVLNPLLEYLQSGIVNKYVGLNAKNSESVLLNMIQISANCCGLYNYTDFKTVNSFVRSTTDSAGRAVELQFPISCCDYQKDFTIDKSTLDNCITNGISKIKSVGCWAIIKPEIEKYFGYSIVCIGITIGILLAVIIAGIIAICCIKEIP